MTATGQVVASRELLAIVDQAVAASAIAAASHAVTPCGLSCRSSCETCSGPTSHGRLAHEDAGTPTALAVADSVINAWFASETSTRSGRLTRAPTRGLTRHRVR